ncbi:Gp19/Gp15/Gp42 family protein [Mycolicibacter virginiensis]|uniref:Gp19/Gp15/Gp42 family protein n=1 Tax=Mycolicibacter virginiensis TaxID=1795032 RepID=UPI001F049E87|nr:Gp19/Gp15/Gp42 family protein [Mycolicibacter virginiensis]ULP49033.1 phage Gp19/Gp15/Gp42 family protein [Mycolicibacter virginiensis]
MAYAEVADVAARLGRTLTTDEQSQAEILLEDVELEIRQRIPDLDEKVTNGDLDESLVVRVESTAVKRVIQNPEGYTSETDGDYTYQLNYQLASGELQITTREWGLLGVGSAMFVIHPRVRTPFERRRVDPRFAFPL